MTIDVPPTLRKARIAAGETAWLDALPDLVDEMASRWSLAIGRSFDGFGMNALVVEATTADGTEVVLKIAPPTEAEKLAHEATVLRLADGDGCARLLDADVDRRAMLLERLGPSMYDLDVPRRQRHELLLDAVRRLWRPVDPNVGLQRGSAYAQSVIDRLPQVWEQSGGACSDRVLADAIACAERRAEAHDDDRAVLCHGDLHELNALQASDGTFKLVDPEGVVAEREFDLGVIMRNAPGDDDLHERADWLAAATGCDRTAIWEWGTAERVLSGLWCRVVDHQPHGNKQLADAERLKRVTNQLLDERHVCQSNECETDQRPEHCDRRDPIRLLELAELPVGHIRLSSSCSKTQPDDPSKQKPEEGRYAEEHERGHHQQTRFLFGRAPRLII